TAGDHWLAAGDAASTFDPLSSQGIMKAMRSALRAAQAIVRHLRGRGTALAQYAELVEREYDRYLDARAAYYRLEQRWPDSPFWQQRQEKMPFQPLQRVSVSEEHSGHVA
ncbi:MAG: tryptophan 7-halogenase, partial [Candidatus Angelobacter sp.]